MVNKGIVHNVIFVMLLRGWWCWNVFRWKIIIFPAGSGLVKLLGSEEKVIELNNYVLDPFISKMNNDGIKQTKADESQDSCMIQQATDNKLDWKCYDVYHIGTEGIIEYCIELEEELVNGGLNLLTQTKLKSVEKKRRYFYLYFKK